MDSNSQGFITPSSFQMLVGFILGSMVIILLLSLYFLAVEVRQTYKKNDNDITRLFNSVELQNQRIRAIRDRVELQHSQLVVRIKMLEDRLEKKK